MDNSKQKTQFKSIVRKDIIQNNWTKVVNEEFMDMDGHSGEYIVVERPPALMILPLLKVNNILYTYLVRQFRYPIADQVWQFPMGTLDKGADYVEHAKEELREETGLQSNNLRFMGNYYIDPGLSRQKCYVYIALDIIEGGSQELEQTEKGMIAQRFTLQEVEAMVQEHGLIDGWIFPGLYYLQHFLKNEPDFFSFHTNG